MHYVSKNLRTAAEIRTVLLIIYCFSAFLTYISTIETYSRYICNKDLLH